jgi:hypothetical protein
VLTAVAILVSLSAHVLSRCYIGEDMLGRTFSAYPLLWLSPTQMAVTQYGVLTNVLGKTKTKEGHLGRVSCRTVTIMESWLTGL